MLRLAFAVAAVLSTLAAYQARDEVAKLYVEPLRIIESVAQEVKNGR